MDLRVLLICAAVGSAYFVVKPVAHVVNKAAHGVEKVVTLGHHPKPKPHVDGGQQ